MGHLFPGADQGCAYDHNGDGSGHGTQVDQQLSEAGEAAENHADDGQRYGGGAGNAVLVQLGKGLGQHTAVRHGGYRTGVEGEHYQHGGEQRQQGRDGDQLRKPRHGGQGGEGSRKHGDEAEARVVDEQLGGDVAHGGDDHQQVQQHNQHHGNGHGFGDRPIGVFDFAHQEGNGHNGTIAHHRVGDGGGIEYHIRAPTVGDPFNKFHGILLHGVEGDVGAQVFRKGPAGGIHLAQDHPGALALGQHHMVLAHDAPADDDHVLAQLDVGPAHAVYAAGQRLRQAGFLVGKGIRDLEQGRCVHYDVIA